MYVQIKARKMVYHCMSPKELPIACTWNVLLNDPTWQLVDAPILHPPYHVTTEVYALYSLLGRPHPILVMLFLGQLLVLGPLTSLEKSVE